MKTNKKISKIIIIVTCVFLLSGCTKVLKNEDNQVVKNEETGQSIPGPQWQSHPWPAFWRPSGAAGSATAPPAG